MKFTELFEMLVESAASFNNWVRPSDQVITREYKVEYELKGLGARYGDPFPTAQDFVAAVRNSKVAQISRSLDRMVGYRSGTRTKESLISLLKSYRSWPEFRNEKTVDAIYDGFENNSPMEMPIILKHKGNMRIFSGNTRADIAFQLDLPFYKAIVVEI